MGTVIDVNARRVVKAHLAGPPRGTLPPGCKGAACPAFAICKGRCPPVDGSRAAPDGGVWIESRG